MKKAKKIIVVGSGIGGLVASIDLARQCVDVLLLEREPQVGGKMRQVSVGSQRLDAGPTLLYDVIGRDKQTQQHGWIYGRDGSVSPLEVSGSSRLRRSLWMLSRHTRHDAGSRAGIARSWEDTPFYTRQLVSTTLSGEPTTLVHETLDLRRFDTSWVRWMLPYRMRHEPGAAGQVPLLSTGGFGGLTEQLGEDMELARRLRHAGYLTVARPILARSTATGRSFGTAVSRYARWLTVIRAQRPWLLPTYPLLFLGTWPLLIGAALLLSQAPLPAAGTAAVALASRWATAHLGRRLSGARTWLLCALLDALAADGLLALAFFRACVSRQVRWRGHRFVVDRSGLLKAR